MKSKSVIFLKIMFFTLLVIAALIIGAAIYCSVLTAGTTLDESKLVNLGLGINFYDEEGNKIDEESSGVTVTKIEDIPEHVKNAFIAIEDKRFYKHNGVDKKGLIRASLNNVKSFSFKEGASTISQQLIKNTHLTNEKTIKRKLLEIKLAKQLEKKYSKDEILEKYLNTIYFGDGCYGITSAAKRYFNKTPSELDVNESAALAALIKAPSNYSPFASEEKCNQRKNLVLNEMFLQNYIDECTYKNYSAQKISVNPSRIESANGYLGYVKKELSAFLDANAYSGKKLNIYTNLNQNAQNNLEKIMKEQDSECDKTAIIIDNNHNVIAYYSTCGEIYRQMGSTIKPLLVYAPAVEYGAVYSQSPILDEKINFNGYAPSNYNDKYYGYVSVKDSLCKSLNSCAVKILNYNGLEKSKSMLGKTDIKFTENDNSLCLALGCTEKGATLTQITAAYNVFANDGNYTAPSAVKKITAENGELLYTRNKISKKIMGEDTAYIISDMLRKTVTDGTAKKLSFLDFPVYSKTGTVGTVQGNTDAYNISYNTNYAIGVWYGNKDNSLMDNSLTGGTLPSITAAEIWKTLKNNGGEITAPDSVCVLPIDKLSYDKDHSVILADDNAPKRYVIEGLFKKNCIPNETSERFSAPIVDSFEISVNKNAIDIRLCLAEYIDAKIFRYENGKKTEIFDTATAKEKSKFSDCDIKHSTVYEYSVIPYFKNDEKVFKGKEIIIGKVKSSDGNISSGDWWIDEED